MDGTYTKVDPRPGERAGCRRCPPYPPEGGVWKLDLDQGTFHVMHERTEWGTLGSTVVVGDRIEFFNGHLQVEARSGPVDSGTGQR